MDIVEDEVVEKVHNGVLLCTSPEKGIHWILGRRGWISCPVRKTRMYMKKEWNVERMNVNRLSIKMPGNVFRCIIIFFMKISKKFVDK
jgi:hypothetical protein